MPDIVIMFFLLGVVAGVAKSDLKVPKAAYDTLSILLMLTLGLKGGLALHGQVTWQLLPEVMSVIALGIAIPLLLYPLLRKLVQLSAANSASIAAHYGSASAGTFAVALAFAEAKQLSLAPQTTLYLVLLELPAIVVAILLYKRATGASGSMKGIWHEALTSRGVVLLAGGVIIGYLYGPGASKEIAPLFLGAFKALLALFLLEMGVCASQHLNPFPWRHWKLVSFALIAPFALAVVGTLVGLALGLPQGSILILATLTASASYIAAPAAIEAAIKEADTGLAIFAALGVTFPLNVLLGIPVYYQLLNLFISQ
ncbi:sodium-dependent bicarbonate transport family permease [Cellvibrio japonicus]|uniref:Sodium bicarbonate cotransporter n=1 Tax=Cellvibrio japonicus (strain Ueda107) TaxID=498211 RepID=B3PBT2_CELJU|nr:sodium-dependent bicarbonate transport family permease [Cellvibrio japonicus]ACE83670.1 sodium bicarbonate cotransporter [Cellvibrio japonicus Ueda107]QEI11749.1 sodium-dependent bicarbonate transport family permease [Cellvibrio japonicus]QEI15323.1 sodium-dependent bicarbonate transport family permease [Cellvibrio japonicus]QEI18903.1 sodium-dependent bicarbonate transport family permease [Cellvibrio japonicus]